ncbi:MULTISPECIES: sugar phosphate isomerase/epimerase family protein [unclassified Sphingobium]|uniref:sugar phosphate isomerase/epimerase family protein n=1 Tax=unclassified Sphingobium TaxID=2611147 RepID=UPI000D15445B|nr:MULTISPECIES: TIM barrel protein [unclassified Sphingobium]MBG6120044.1 sugar phosphate isomerase/epimerase [Sphingobium sp. JAI105]PSO12901.1 hypothetical protein C7E20_03890 [Sphingobium sp. AEW4]TWD05755.1 sugar phosphate isomerase/epimerase [Sphingobium sp. AEW010]TWD23308.1 sugar phosphate isomerase/epimerase [Sphingobium sp. AEW013]TWD25168.1 sugar phosphate isomerase/epimerase [Sphingobium sp. AEW001]
MAFGIDHLTLGHFSPPDFARMAGEAGAATISLFLHPNPSVGGDPANSPLEHLSVRRAAIDAVRAAGVKVAVAEGCRIAPDFSLDEQKRRMETAVDLGAPRLNVLITDPEQARADENFALFAAEAAKAGLELLIEFTPLTEVHDLVAADGWARRHGCGIMFDTLHYERTGGTLDQLAAYVRDRPGMIGYVQVCDGPAGRYGDFKAYAREAVRHRFLPGAGAIPLREILSILPADLITSAETPNAGVYKGEVAPDAHLAATAIAMRALLEASGR